MPDAPTAPELSSMDATILALNSAMESGQPVAGVPGVESTANTLDEFQAKLPDPTPAPAAEPAPAPTPADDEPAAPVLHPSAKSALPEGMPRNFRLAAQDEAEALAFQIRKSNPNMHMREALAQAEQQLGIQPTAPAAPTTPAAPADPVTELETQIKTLREQRKALNPALDGESYTELSEQIEDLNTQKAELKARSSFNESIQHQQAVAAELTAAEAQFNEVAGVFEDLRDDSTEFATAFFEEHKLNNAAADKEERGEKLTPEEKYRVAFIATETYEIDLAEKIAGRFQRLNKTFKVKGAATTPASSPTNPPGTPPAVSPAVIRSTAPAPASMAPLPGNHTAPTSEHRVIVQPADPQAAAQQQIASAAAAGDSAAVLAALNLSLGGLAPPTGLTFHSIE